MKIREEYKIREMAGEHVIVMPGGDGAADMTRIVSLNPSSLYLWEVDAETALQDAGLWVARLAECGIVE